MNGTLNILAFIINNFCNTFMCTIGMFLLLHSKKYYQVYCSSVGIVNVLVAAGNKAAISSFVS